MIGLMLWASTLSHALGILELQVPIRDAAGNQVDGSLALAFPDSLSGTDVHALLAAQSGTQTVLLPGGRLRPQEADFVDGLRAFSKSGGGEKADSLWARLRRRRLEPVLQSSFNVDLGFLLCLRGETQNAEALWKREWNRSAPAREAAWRNLLGLYLAQRRYETANQVVDIVLSEQPHNRMAALGKASLLKQLRPDAEWERFLILKSSPEDSMPYMQLEYGELLVTQKRYAQAVKILDHGLADLPREGRSWRFLAEAQYHLGYYYFALDCLENAERSGYHEPDLYELYARVLRGCCMSEDDPRAEKSLKAVEHILEEGFPKDFHRRSMAQLLYHIYCQNLKPDAAKQLRGNFWFHFEGPSQNKPVFGYGGWPYGGLESLGLKIPFGLHDFQWVMALRGGDFYQAFY